MGYDATLKVKGVRPPDGHWKRMKAIWDSCQAADVDVPGEVEKFFDYKDPSPEGIEIDVPMDVVDNGDEFKAIGIRNGPKGNYYLIDIAQLPDNITHLKVWLDESY